MRGQGPPSKILVPPSTPTLSPSHHLLEGALGPEYRYSAEDSGTSPRRLCVDTVIEAGLEMRCQSLAPAARRLATELGLSASQLPRDVVVAAPPPPPYPRQVWSFEVDVLSPDRIDQWQLCNINHVLVGV